MLSVKQFQKIFVEGGLIEGEKFSKAKTEAKKSGKSIDTVLIEEGAFTADQAGTIIADAYGVDFVDFERVDLDPNAVRLIPELIARKRGILPFGWRAGVLRVAMVDPSDAELVGYIEKKTGSPVEPGYTPAPALDAALSVYSKDILGQLTRMIEEYTSTIGHPQPKKGVSVTDQSVIKIVDSLMRYGYENNASDVHVEPHRKESTLRYRIDGILHDVITIPKPLHEKVVSRIKILSNLRTDEHFAAQDGKFRFRTDGTGVDVRVSIIPVVGGEKVVMRILADKGRAFTLETIGMGPEDYEKVKRAAKRPHGMLLATGPTGSGKTTTMYAVLKLLNRREVNIQTIEDPVEYDVSGVNQIQVNTRTNLTFAAGLRSIVRQDPDIIMVGEVRDPETAQIAVNAAMTGHLVLSTLHTNDAPTALPRLRNMEVAPFLIASAVNVVIAQRLVRHICRKCIGSVEIDVSAFKSSIPESIYAKYFGKNAKARFYRGKGCANCGHTGFEGRIGIYEVLEVTEGIREKNVSGATSDAIREQALAEGMTTLFEDGIKKVLTGDTTIEEVLRVAVD